ncbi:G-type lectin S-receptor-like serine/threonine-protein kinase LECRK2 [Prunus yedoensis var. nudiflora]|uniref:G-type lectin S-receptor-like serine/threonine-protein kinase LECRK2 n=1 Tax=Prunus yedoensis var. nudiflora TaxID=2094558 RepID=A0A314UEC4_PRUYE|nr:G-type lectin S-receptor-like serine/threonine-protein kinase LECRK2 [Prunus yedoensis var. nudiflora]
MASALLCLSCFFLIILLPCTSLAQTSTNISLGSSLAALNDNLSWPSPSGEFAFGFRQIGKSGFLLAIWFNKIPDRTIVWSANRNDLVQEGSKVELTSDGMLVLRNSEGDRYGVLILLAQKWPMPPCLTRGILCWPTQTQPILGEF